MSGRLAEIERRHDVSRPALLAGAKRARSTYEWVTDEVVTAIEQDIPWLIARIKKLEAQAALDATVVEAIGPYREADSAVTRAYNRYVASNGTSEEAVAEFDLNWTRGVFVGYERVLDDALDAALAARKGMT